MATQIFHFSNAGISSGQRFYLKDQISGIFLNNLNVNSNFPVVASNLVYNTGNQTISGNKTFQNNIDVQGTGIFSAVDLNNIDNLSISGVDISISNGNTYVSGGWIYISGNPVLTGSTKLSTLNLNNIVYTTGNQTIDGLKDFTTRPTVNTVPVLLSGEVNTIISGVLYTAQVNIKNDNGSTIYKGQPVYVSSAAGTNILVKLASNTGEIVSSKTLGLVYQTSLAQNTQGTIVTDGLLQGFDTTAGNEGDPIWLGPTGSLIYGLVNKPYAPNHLVYLGVLTRKHQNQGEIFVKIQNGFELQELHNVNIDHYTSLTANQVLKYNETSGLWFNQTLSSSDLSNSNQIVYTTGNQTISGDKTFSSRPNVNSTGIVLTNELINSGSLLNNKINSLSGYVDSRDILFSGTISSTGSILDNKINALSGSVVLTYGNQNVYGIKNFYSGIVVTGNGSTNGGYSFIIKNGQGVNGVSFNPASEGNAGNLYFNAGSTSRIYNVGDSTLEFFTNSNPYRVANSLTIGNGSNIPDHTAYVINRYGYFGIGSGFSNPLERLHVSGGNLRVDGKIYLSGNLVLTGVDLTPYAANSLSGQVVFTTGNQTILGQKTFSGTTTVIGHFAATSKSFLIDHPLDNNKKLQYASLEGPEHGVFLRGKTNENIINLPNYWSGLVDENSISVNLTPINVYSNIYVVDYNNTRVITNGNNGNYYFYTIYGERKDIPKLTVEF